MEHRVQELPVKVSLSNGYQSTCFWGRVPMFFTNFLQDLSKNQRGAACAEEILGVESVISCSFSELWVEEVIGIKKLSTHPVKISSCGDHSFVTNLFIHNECSTLSKHFLHALLGEEAAIIWMFLFWVTNCGSLLVVPSPLQKAMMGSPDHSSSTATNSPRW